MRHSSNRKLIIIAVVAVLVFLGVKKGLIPNPFKKVAA
jgi:hypothetical protein